MSSAPKPSQSVEAWLAKVADVFSREETAAQYHIGRRTGEDEDGTPIFDLEGEAALEAVQARQPGRYWLVKAGNLSDFVCQCRIGDKGQRLLSHGPIDRMPDASLGRSIAATNEAWGAANLFTQGLFTRAQERVEKLESEADELKDRVRDLEKQLQAAQEENGESEWADIARMTVEAYTSKSGAENIKAKLAQVLPLLDKKEQATVQKVYQLMLVTPDPEPASAED